MNLNFIGNNFFKSEQNRFFIRFIRLVAVVGIVIACLAILIPLAVLDGFHKELRAKAVSFASHLTVRTLTQNPIKNSDSLSIILQDRYPVVESAFPILQQGAIMKQKDNSDGILIYGCIDSLTRKTIGSSMVEGEFEFSSQDTNQIIISQNIARKMNLKLGDKTLIFAIDTENFDKYALPDIAPFFVKGIYSTGMAEYDDVVCYMPIKIVRKFFGYGQHEATSVDLMLTDIEVASELSSQIDSYLGYPYFSLTVFDSHQSIFNWIDLQREPIPIVLGLISIVAVFNIISILLILVLIKIKSIGTLRAMGMPATQIRKLFLMEGMKLATTGVVIGCVLAFSLTILQKMTGFIPLDAEIYYLDKVPIAIDGVHYLIVISITLLMAAGASYMPAVVASKISPIKAMRFK